MEPSDRRIGIRIDLEVFLTEYIRDRPFRVLSSNLSETGLYIHRVAPDPDKSLVRAGTAVGIELELPGTGEVIWARGEVCREAHRVIRHDLFSDSRGDGSGRGTSWGSRRSPARRAARLVPMPPEAPLGHSRTGTENDRSAVVFGAGLRFADMPRVFARMVRDFCHERRQARLDELLDRIRRTPPAYVPRPGKTRGSLRRRILAESGSVLAARRVA